MPPAVAGVWSPCPSKPMPRYPSRRAARKEYIVAKYMERRYVQKSGRDDPHRLWEAIRARDLLALLQAFAEGHDLAKPLASPEGQVSPTPPWPPAPSAWQCKWVFLLWVPMLRVFLAFGWRCALGKMSILRSSSLLPSILEKMKHPGVRLCSPLYLVGDEHPQVQFSPPLHFMAGPGRAGTAHGRAPRRQIVPSSGGLHHPERVRPQLPMVSPACSPTEGACTSSGD